MLLQREEDRERMNGERASCKIMADHGEEDPVEGVTVLICVLKKKAFFDHT